MKYCPAVMMYDMQKAYRIYAYMLLYTCKYNNNKKGGKVKFWKWAHIYISYAYINMYILTYIIYAYVCACIRIWTINA